MNKRILGGLALLIYSACLALIVGDTDFARADQKFRKTAVAGSFYPGDKSTLQKQVAQLLNQAEKRDVGGTIIGLVVPHAGYVYSAATAARGFKQVEGMQPELVVVLAPSHRDPFDGATVYSGDGYETPLGRCYIDKNVAESLVIASKFVVFSEQGHRAEHSLEVELPFIKTLFPDARILPIVVGRVDWDMCRDIGAALAQSVAGKKVLLVASSDLYHGESYEDCKRISSRTLDALAHLDPQAFFAGLRKGEYSACGGAPAAIMEVAAKNLGANRGQVLYQTNSADVTGRNDSYVVGYGTVVIYQAAEGKSTKQEFPPLPPDVQKEIIKIARAAIEGYFEGKRVLYPEKYSPLLAEKRGVFVTLTRDGRLRGCIGHHLGDKPLYQLVPEMACAAAFSDPRFPPLERDELKRTKIKVSVYLTNVYPIASLDEFELGVHGIIMQKDGRAATFLPEVPIEAGWKTVEEEMRNLCYKAGLELDAWKNGASFWVYKTQVFDEDIVKR